MSRPMSYANRELILTALAECPVSPADLAALTGESVGRIDNWLKTRRHDHQDVYVWDWRHVAGTSGGYALWRAGPGVSKPYPKSDFQRLRETQKEAMARAADIARQRASIPKRATRDPAVVALFGPYRPGRPHEMGRKGPFNPTRVRKDTKDERGLRQATCRSVVPIQ